MHAPALVVQRSATSRHPELGQVPRGPRHRNEVTGRERRACALVKASFRGVKEPKMRAVENPQSLPLTGRGS